MTKFVMCDAETVFVEIRAGLKRHDTHMIWTLALVMNAG